MFRFVVDAEPVAGNYYPVNSRAYIKGNRGVQLTVLTDRSVGGSSLKDGSLEFMIHRRLQYNDGTVGGEPLNEPGRDGRGLIVRGRFLVLLETSKNSARLHRVVGEEEFLRPFLAFSDNAQLWTEYDNKFRKDMRVENRYKRLQGLFDQEDQPEYQIKNGYQSLTRPLPANVHLLTLEKRGKVLLLRLEHQFAVDEDDELSKSVSVQLKGLFNDFTILSVTEVNLSANQVKADQKFAMDSVGVSPQNKTVPKDDFVVTLNAMEIKTFEIDVEWKRRHSC